MSDHLSEDARREAARRRLQERQARERAESAAQPRQKREAANSQTPQAERKAHTEHDPQAKRGARAPRIQRPSSETAAAPKQRITREEAHGKAPKKHQARAANPITAQSKNAAASSVTAANRIETSPAAKRSRSASSEAAVPTRTAAGANAIAAVKGKAASTYAALCSRFGKRNTFIGAGAAVITLIVIIFGIRACTTPADPVQQALGKAERAVSTSSYANDDGSKPIQSTLVSLIGDEETATLLDAASSNEDVYWIASHPDSFLADGDAVQAKLLKLAGNEPEAARFVRNWPDEYPQDAPSGDAATPSAEGGTNIPRLYQWDKRWGYTVYSSTTFALTGCCPTALAMVYQGLTGNTDKSPYDMGQLARSGGYETQYDGTDGTFLLETADQLGLSCTQLTPIASNITSTLSSGKVLIVNVGPGDFTTNGHYIVACGLDNDGKVIVNDPYSAKRSDKTWDVNTLVDQAKAIYVYSV